MTQYQKSVVNKRGYFGIGIYHTKTKTNIGTLWRSAKIFGASFIFTIGKRYKSQSSDTIRAPRHIPLFHYSAFDDFYKGIPYNCKLIGIEQTENSKNIVNFVHPERAVYLLGAEDYGLPPTILDKCQSVIHIETPLCLNVSVAGSIILFDRQTKNRRR